MQFKKYSSHNEAVKDLEKSGELKYFGREGWMAEGYVYQYIIGREINTIVIYEDGRVVHIRA